MAGGDQLTKKLASSPPAFCVNSEPRNLFLSSVSTLSSIFPKAFSWCEVPRGFWLDSVHASQVFSGTKHSALLHKPGDLPKNRRAVNVQRNLCTPTGPGLRELLLPSVAVLLFGP